MSWSNIEIDKVKPICVFDVSNTDKVKETFNSIKTQPLLKTVHQHRGTKPNIFVYVLQFTSGLSIYQIESRETEK